VAEESLPRDQTGTAEYLSSLVLKDSSRPHRHAFSCQKGGPIEIRGLPPSAASADVAMKVTRVRKIAGLIKLFMTNMPPLCVVTGHRYVTMSSA
jgi:hypothetical protein